MSPFLLSSLSVCFWTLGLVEDVRFVEVNSNNEKGLG